MNLLKITNFIENERFFQKYKFSLNRKIFVSVLLLFYFTFFKNFQTDSLERFENFGKEIYYRNNKDLKRILNTPEKVEELVKIVNFNLKLFNGTSAYNIFGWLYRFKIQRNLKIALQSTIMREEDKEEIILMTINNSILANFSFIFANLLFLINLRSSLTFMERYHLLTTEIPKSILYISLRYFEKTKNVYSEVDSDKNCKETFINFVIQFNKLKNLNNISSKVRDTLAALDKRAQDNDLKYKNIPSQLDFSSNDITSVSKRPFFIANMVSLLVMGAKILPASRRGEIIKENLEFIIAILIAIGYAIAKSYTLYFLIYCSILEKIFSFSLFFFTIIADIIFLNYIKDMTIIAPLNISLIASCLSSSYYEADLFYKEIKLLGLVNAFVNDIPKLIWSIVFFFTTIFILSLKLVLILRLEKSASYRETQHRSLLDNTKSIMFLDTLKDFLAFILKNKLKNVKKDSLLLLFFRYGFTPMESLLELFRKRMFVELIFNLVVANSILLAMNYLVTFGLFEKQQIELQTKNLQKYGRTLVGCDGGYAATYKELLAFSNDYSYLNTTLLLLLYNTGNFRRITFFGSGTNLIHIVHMLILLRSTIKQELKSEDSHYLLVNYSEFTE